MAFEPFTKAEVPSMANFNRKFRQAIGAAVEMTPPPGSIFWFASQAVPDGFLLCDGSLISRTDYSNLFDAIGTTFGAGDGETTFALPDLRAKFVRGAGSNGGYGATFGVTQEASYSATGSNEHSVTVINALGVGSVFGNTDKRSSAGTPHKYAYISEPPTGDTSFSYYNNFFRPYNISLTPIIKY